MNAMQILCVILNIPLCLSTSLSNEADIPFYTHRNGLFFKSLSQKLVMESHEDPIPFNATFHPTQFKPINPDVLLTGQCCINSGMLLMCT